MKRAVVFALAAVIDLLAACSALATTWVVHDPTDPILLDSIASVGDGFVVTGGWNFSTSPQNKAYRVLVMGVNADGTVAWQKLYGPQGIGDVGGNVVPTADGGTIVEAGRGGLDPTHCGGGCDGLWLLKLDATGGVQWQRLLTASTPGNVDGAGPGSLQQTSDGGYVLSGVVSDVARGASTDVLVAKLDRDGKLTWQKRYDGGLEDSGVAMLETTSGYLVTGQTQTGSAPGAPRMTWVLALDATGTPIWQREYDVGSDCIPTAVTTAGDGFEVLISREASGNLPSGGVQVTIGADGSVASAAAFGAADLDIGLMSQHPLAGGGTAIVGLEAPVTTSAPDVRAWALFLDAAGRPAAQHAYGDPIEFDFGGAPTTDGGLVIPVTSRTSGNPHVTALLFRVDATGDLSDACASLVSDTDVTFTTASVTPTDTHAVAADAGVVATDTTETPEDATAELAPVCQAGSTSSTLPGATTTTTPGGTTTTTTMPGAPCDSIDTCYVALGTTLPTLSGEVVKKTRRATTSLQRKYKKLGKALTKAASSPAKKQARRYRKAKKMTLKLLKIAGRYDKKGTLDASLPGVQSADAALVAQIP
jgi:hypothetical protein